MYVKNSQIYFSKHKLNLVLFNFKLRKQSITVFFVHSKITWNFSAYSLLSHLLYQNSEIITYLLVKISYVALCLMYSVVTGHSFLCLSCPFSCFRGTHYLEHCYQPQLINMNYNLKEFIALLHLYPFGPDVTGVKWKNYYSLLSLMDLDTVLRNRGNYDIWYENVGQHKIKISNS